MASDIPNDQGFWAIAAAVCGAIIGSFGTTIGHLFRSRASMAALVDARIRMLIDGYERRIGDLQEEIKRLEDKVDALSTQLEETQRAIEICDECGKLVKVKDESARGRPTAVES
jgi:phosphate uptake regulator